MIGGFFVQRKVPTVLETLCDQRRSIDSLFSLQEKALVDFGDTVCDRWFFCSKKSSSSFLETSCDLRLPDIWILLELGLACGDNGVRNGWTLLNQTIEFGTAHLEEMHAVTALIGMQRELDRNQTLELAPENRGALVGLGATGVAETIRDGTDNAGRNGKTSE